MDQPSEGFSKLAVADDVTPESHATVSQQRGRLDQILEPFLLHEAGDSQHHWRLAAATRSKRKPFERGSVVHLAHAERSGVCRQPLQVGDVVARAREHHARGSNFLPQQGRRRVIEVPRMCAQAVPPTGQEMHDVRERAGLVNEGRVHMRHTVPSQHARQARGLRESRDQIALAGRDDAEQR